MDYNNMDEPSLRRAVMALEAEKLHQETKRLQNEQEYIMLEKRRVELQNNLLQLEKKKLELECERARNTFYSNSANDEDSYEYFTSASNIDMGQKK